MTYLLIFTYLGSNGVFFHFSLSKPEILSELISLITTEPPADVDENTRFKLPHVASGMCISFDFQKENYLWNLHHWQNFKAQPVKFSLLAIIFVVLLSPIWNECKSWSSLVQVTLESLKSACHFKWCECHFKSFTCQTNQSKSMRRLYRLKIFNLVVLRFFISVPKIFQFCPFVCF